MDMVSFSVPFVRGKGRVRFVRGTGRTYTPDKTAEAMELIRMAYAREAGGRMAENGVPVRVSITTARGMPKSRPKSLVAEQDVFKPDVDNIAKLVLDALNGIAWEDDTQVTTLTVQKYPRDRVSDEQTHVVVSWDGELDGRA
jgi:Holliday junction resolvase RusA-like endonuclease